MSQVEWAPEMTLLRGVPGSGKSTVANQMFRSDPERYRIVERDEIRTRLFGEEYHKGKFPKHQEQHVSKVQYELLNKYLSTGKHVIVSDTNLGKGTVTELVALGRRYGITPHIVPLDVPPEECIRRNKARGAAGGREVPEGVLKDMIKMAYGQDGHLKECVIGSNGQVFFVPQNTPGSLLMDDYNKVLAERNPIRGKAVVAVDVDGTLADNREQADRAFGQGNKNKDFPYFFRSIKDARPNQSVVDLCNEFRANNLNMFVLTGRSDEAAAELIEFLERSKAPISKVMLKRHGDNRPDMDYKAQQLGIIADEGLIVTHAIDDRPRSIKVYEDLGILVSKVPYHEPQRVSPPGGYEPIEVERGFAPGHCIRCGAKLKSGIIGPGCRTKMSI